MSDAEKIAPGFREDLENLINRHSKENGSNTPDFILAEYLLRSLETFDRAVRARTNWYKPVEPLEDMQ